MAENRNGVEIVRRIMDAQARRDWAAVFALYDEEIEWDQSRNPYAIDLPAKGTGHEAVRVWFRRMGEAWDQYEYEDDGLVEAGDQVVQLIRWRARGRTSGIVLERPFAQVWTLRGGRVVRVEYFPNRAEALAAVGLPRQQLGRSA